MPRVVSTVWFEDIGYLNQPMFHFPLVTLTIRQLIHLALWGGVAYMIFSVISPLFTMSLIFRIIPALSVFALGMAFFGRKGKVFTPEWYLIHFLGNILPGSGGLSLSTSSSAGEKERKPQGRRRAKPMVAPIGEPTRIAGALFDPSSGQRLSGARYEVLMDGEPYTSGKTDEDGSYSFIFTPPSPGLYTLSVKPEGYPEPAEEMKIDSRPSSSSESGGESPVERESLERPSAEGQEGERELEEEEDYIYELFPVNFADLPEDEKDKVVDSFRGFLNSLNTRIKIVALKTSKEVELGEESAETEFFKFYLKSEESIDAKLDSAGFRYQRVAGSPEPQVVRTFKDFVALEGGKNAKTGTVYQMRERLTEGFTSLLYGSADRVTISIRPLNQGESVQKMERFARMKRSQAARTDSESKRAEADRAQKAVERLSEGSARLFETTVNATAGGETEEEMQANYDRLESVCEGRMVRIADPMGAQEEMIKGEEGKSLYMDTVTLGAFFPFVSANVIETPGGVFLGTNLHTGAPVIYDPLVRSNAHACFIGRTGAGKSFATKAYLSRLFEKHQDMAFFIVDPESEYTRPALELDRTGTDIRKVSPEREMGLDPLQLYPKDKEVVINMLSEALSISREESGLLSNLRRGVQQCSSLEQLQEWADDEFAERLNGLLKGPEQFLFRGETKGLSERVVFDLGDIHRGVRVASDRVGTLDIASILVFGQIWRKIEELPREKLKVVIIDEVWLYTKLPAAASFLEHVSRRGRRRNVVFLLASQHPEDVLESQSGRSALQNCATKVIMQEDQSSADLVGDAFGLTESEVEATMDFDPGQAVLSSMDVKAPLKFVASPGEYRWFTTKPEEVA